MMPIYEYETIPQSADEQPVRLELRQTMSDTPFTRHPETGKPIKRVYAAFSVGAATGRSGASMPMPSGGCCCNPGGSCAFNN
jgi:predicted nucleic acid-binding Zn ribbon protein